MLFFLIAAGAFAVFYVNQQITAITHSPQVIIHEAHLSSGWYPRDGETLHREIAQYLEASRTHLPVSTNPHQVRALLVPHAGYFYSGLCAATAYQTLLEPDQSKNSSINRVIVIAPSHTTYFEGVALPDYTAYKTPLGTISVDHAAVTQFAQQDGFSVNASAHAREHAIEIQLPFLQETVADFAIVPLIVGHLTPASTDIICATLRQLLNEQTLVVVSSDFMHHGPQFQYTPFNEHIAAHIQYVDSMAIKAITAPSLRDFSDLLDKTSTTICGQNPIKLFLTLCEHGDLGPLDVQLANYYTSAQLSQARTAAGIELTQLFAQPDDAQAAQSVSYVGLVCSTPQQRTKEDSLTGYEKKALLHTARHAIANAFAPADAQVDEHLLWPPLSPALTKPVGAFVTLNTRDGNLRGCIGQIIATQPLFKTAIDMARAAAFRDRRFAPLTADELENIDIDITILSQPHAVASLNEIELGRHGIILNRVNPTTSAVFLPQVPLGFGWTREETLSQLSVKAGLAPDGWKENCTFEVFEGFEIHE